jgi:hypothetical protein
MIAPTGRVRKSSEQWLSRFQWRIRQKTRQNKNSICAGIVITATRLATDSRFKKNGIDRHGIVSGIHNTAQLPPIDRPASLRQTNPALARSFRRRIPQPPAPRGRRDRACSQVNLSPYWANGSWSFFFCLQCVGGLGLRLIRKRTTLAVWFERSGKHWRGSYKRQRICRFRIALGASGTPRLSAQLLSLLNNYPA